MVVLMTPEERIVKGIAVEVLVVCPSVVTLEALVG
jgi:hypothetical protein